MKIYIANYTPDKLGGGHSFMRTFAQYMGANITNDYDQADVYFISGPTIVERDAVLKARKDSKKIVLRVDNVVRNSRNRSTGMSRLYDFSQIADLVIYQSNYCLDLLRPFTHVDGPIILNGINLDIFTDKPKPTGDFVLYSRYNRDENKNFDVARDWFTKYQIDHPDARLLLVGRFSDNLRAANFDFYNNENYEYLGALQQIDMATIYRAAHKLLYTYWGDACPNTLIEALCSGCEIVGHEYYRSTGGAPEIIAAFNEQGREYFAAKRMVDEYKEAIKRIL